MVDTRVSYDIVSRDRSQRGWDEATKRARKESRQIGQFIGRAFATAGAAAFTTSIVNQGSELAKLADRFGITVESASRLQFAFERNNLSSQQFANVLRATGVRVQEAAAGNREYADAFDDLGLSAEELVNLNVDDQFRRIAAALRDSPDALRIAQRLLEEQGPLILSFVGDLEFLEQRAVEVGREISDEFARQAEDLEDAYTDALGRVTDVLRKSVVGWARIIEFFSQSTRDALNLEEGTLSQQIAEVEERARSAGDEVERLETIQEQLQARGVGAENSLARINEKLFEARFAYSKVREELTALQNQLSGEIIQEVQVPRIPKLRDPSELSAREQREADALRERQEAELRSLEDASLFRNQLEELNRQRSIERARTLGQELGISQQRTQELITQIELKAAVERSQEVLKIARDAEESRQQLTEDRIREEQRLAERAEDARLRQLESISTQIVGSFTRAGADIEDVFSQTLANLASQLAESAFLRLLGSVFGFSPGTVTGGGGIFSLLGFANGGSFTVGGQGGLRGMGRDDTLVAFAAKRGEQVTVTPPNQQTGKTINITNNIDARGADAGLVSRLPALAAGITARTEASLRERERRGLS